MLPSTVICPFGLGQYVARSVARQAVVEARDARVGDSDQPGAFARGAAARGLGIQVVER
jgi:hypothetical protein